MRLWMIAFSLGVWLASFVSELPPLPFLFLLPIPLVLAIVVHWYLSTHQTKVSLVLLSLCAFSLGVLWMFSTFQRASSHLYPKELERIDVWVRGTITGLPKVYEDSSRIVLKVDSLCENKSSFETLVEIGPDTEDSTCFTLKRIILNDYSGLHFQTGETWELKVRLKRPHGFANPNTFDYEAWLWQQGVSASGYIREDEQNTKLNSAKLWSSVGTLRFRLREAFNRLIDGKGLQHPGLILALTLGDRELVDQQQWDLFTETGTIHLMVISGLHIGLVAGLLFVISRFIYSRSTYLISHFPAQRLAALTAVIVAFIYCGLAGFSLPTQRALIMVIAGLWGELFLRQHNVFNSLCLALGIILLINPLAVLSSGFWLSFGAVSILLCFALKPKKYDELDPVERLTGKRQKSILLSKLRSHLYAQFILMLGLVPFMFIFFNGISLVAPMVNMVAIPLVGMVIVPLCLLGIALLFVSTELAWPFILSADILLSIFITGISMLSDIFPLSYLRLPSLSLFSLLLVSASVLLLLMPIKTAWKVLSVVGLIPILNQNSATTALAYGHVRLHLLDVGQGLAAVIETQNSSIIYDSGPLYSQRFNAGSDIVVPFVMGNNIPEPSLILISHGDNDHAGGAQALIESFPKAPIFSGEANRLTDRLGYSSQNAEHVLPCQQGQHWGFDGVSFSIVHPNITPGFPLEGNNASCVLRITTGEHSMLITGDIERRVERGLLSQNPDELAADLIVVPHHGSNTSSTSDFIAQVNPAIALISSGYLNRFNHPHPLVLERYARAGVEVFTTSNSGALSITFSPNSLGPVSEYRVSHRKLWRTQ